MTSPDSQYCHSIESMKEEYSISRQPSRNPQHGMSPKDKIRLILECSHEERLPVLRTISQDISRLWIGLGWEVCLVEMKGSSKSSSDIPRRFLVDNLSYMIIRCSKPEEISRKVQDYSGNHASIGDDAFSWTLKLIGTSINDQIMQVLRNLNLSNLYLQECSFTENGHFETFSTLKKLYMRLRQDVISEFTLPPYLEELVIYFSESFSPNLHFFFDASKCESLAHM